MGRKRDATDSGSGAMRRRLQRLKATLAACDRPIVWLRGGPGSGKTRLLAALRSAASAPRRPAWLLLDAPDPAQLAVRIKACLASRGRRGLLVASRPDDPVAGVLLAPRFYGEVQIIEDAQLYLRREDCRGEREAAMFAASGGWPVLADAYLAGSGEERRALLPAFLEREVLPGLPPALVTALFAALTAPLEAPVMQHLFAQSSAPHPLLATQGATTTIAGSWVREALLVLRRQPRALSSAVRTALTGLYAHFADPEQAILALLQIGQLDEAMQIFLRSGGAFFGYRHGYQSLQRVLEALGADQEQRSEELFIARLWLLIKSGQPREALLRLDGRYPGLPVDLRRLRLSHRPLALLLRIDISLDIDETPPLAVIASWGRLQGLLPAGEELARGLLFNTMAIGFLQADALLEAEQLAEEALAAYERADSPYLAHFMQLHLCDVALRQSRLADAGRRLERADAGLRASGLAFNSEPAIIESFRARIAYEAGRFAECPAATEPLLQALLRGDSWIDLIASMAATFVLTTFWARGLRSALESLDNFALTLSRRHGWTRHRGLELLRIRLLQVARRHAEAGLRLEEYDLDGAPVRSAHLAAEEGLVRLRHLIVQERVSAEAQQLAGALASLPSLELRQRITLAILQSYLGHRDGDPARARRHLRVALRAAEARELLGVLAEDGELLERLLPVLLADPGPGSARLVAFAQRTLRLLHSLPAAPQHSKALAGITRQEHRVLGYLVDGYTNKQIARALALSDSGVKFHLRGLFRKLRVGSRAELAEVSLQRGIVT